MDDRRGLTAGIPKRYRQLLTVVLFLVILFAAFEFSGLREHFSLDFSYGRYA